MNDAIETENYKGYTINIHVDTDPNDPREWDNLGKMVCFHKRYSLGDKTDLQSDDYNDWDEVEEAIKKSEEVVAISPLYLYDHSGLRIKIGNFYGLLPEGHARFDSGQIGFIYATAKAVREGFGVKKITKAILAKVEKSLEAEVKTYDDYLSGNVYGFTIEKDGENLDSCWGFSGDTKGAIADAKSNIDVLAEEAKNKRQEKLKALITHQVPLGLRALA